MELKNAFLTAQFEPDTGMLTALNTPAGQPLVVGSELRHVAMTEPNVWRRDWQVEALDVTKHAIRGRYRSPELVVSLTYSLAPDEPMLRVAVSMTRGDAFLPVRFCGLPALQFAPEFTDAFEDDDDLYFDGEERGDGTQLPCWRVFFCEKHQHGLLVATRSKADMGHFQIQSQGFEIVPHLTIAYNTSIPYKNTPPDFDRQTVYETSFEIGPWTRATHDELLATARLREPVAVDTPPLTGSAPKVSAGEFIKIDLSHVTTTARDSWRQVTMPCAQGGTALFADANAHPPPICIRPNLSGWYRIHVGVANGQGVGLRLDSDAHTTFRTRSGTFFHSPFDCWLAGEQSATEVTFKEARLDGRTLELHRHPSSSVASLLDYVRFEPLSDDEVAILESRERPMYSLSGFADIPDIKVVTDALDPDPDAYASNIWEHANCGFSKIYWRIDGQCSDFPATCNTMRYVSAKVHGVFNPQSKSYGRVLKKTDMLRLAVDAARKYGVELYGWMRFNSYAGNVQSQFFVEHPEFHEEGENGVPAKKLCLAFPEVRKHKIDILVEAASYGLDGLNMGFLRHPPILHYAPVLVSGFEAEYGHPPPRVAAHNGAEYRDVVPPRDEAHEKWFRYRARFMTLFMRELKAALREAGLEHVKLSAWLRSTHCLYDGIDLPTWLDEGLLDEVVAQDKWILQNDDFRYDISPEWKAMVQAKARLVRAVYWQDATAAEENYRRALEEEYDGICTYESNMAVLDSAYIPILKSLAYDGKMPDHV